MRSQRCASLPCANSPIKCSRRLASLASSTLPKAVFLDTEVFVSLGFNTSTSKMRAIRDHTKSGRLRLITTDITQREIQKKIADEVRAAADAHKKTLKTLRVLGKSRDATVKALADQFNPDDVEADLSSQLQEFLSETEAEILPTNEVSIDRIFDSYFAKLPPFGSAPDKQREFPDAFTIEALKSWADDTGERLFVVSNDQLFRDACEAGGALIPKSSLSEVLNQIASDDAELSEFIRSYVAESQDEIIKELKQQFEDLTFYVRDQNGDGSVRVTNATLSGSPEILEIRDSEADLQVEFTFEFVADLSYDDPDMSVWDSEDGELMVFGTKHEQIERQLQVSAEVGIVFDGLDPDGLQLNYVNLDEPSDPVFLKTQDDFDWPHK